MATYRRILLAAAAIALSSGFAFAQPAAPAPAPTVLRLESFGQVVGDLDKAVKFYRDVIGLDLVTPPTTASEPTLNLVTNTQGARLRFARFRIPNEPYAIELDEYSGIDRKAMQANHNDPGSSFINIGYWDGPAAFDILRKAKPVVMSKNGIPATVTPGKMAGVWIRDPDGHMMEFMQGGWDPDRKSYVDGKNVYRGHFGMTLETHQQALAFYRDLLGFDIEDGFPPMVPAGEFRSAAGLSGIGVPASANWTGVHGHCAGARCEMFEFKDAPRTAFRPRMQDPGASYLSVWVSDIDGLLAKMKAAGIEVVTPGGAPIAAKVKIARDVVPLGGTLPPMEVRNSRQILVRDPGGFFILLMQPVPG